MLGNERLGSRGRHRESQGKTRTLHKMSKEKNLRGARPNIALKKTLLADWASPYTVTAIEDKCSQ